jgi:antagonist of KipI
MAGEGKPVSIEIVKPGLLSTVQDAGRAGYRRYGVAAGGAMDAAALRAANLLVGNDPGAACLEFTLTGPEIRFHAETVIALCGGRFHAVLDGSEAPFCRPIRVQPESVLRIGHAVGGCRGYLAAAGGIDVPPVMGSRSTYLRAGIGGHEGRALREGDKLSLGKLSPLSQSLLKSLSAGRIANWFVSEALLPLYDEEPEIRVVRGPEFHLFTEESVRSFFSQEYAVLTQSDRMGYRLRGEAAMKRRDAAADLLTEPVHPGTVQVPPEGQPIVLMADGQTTGGYPRIAQVVQTDIPLLAQVRPGLRLRFREVSLREAQELYLWRELEWKRLEAGIRAKLAGC